MSRFENGGDAVREDTTVFVNQSAKLFLPRDTEIDVIVRGIEAEHRTSFSPSLALTLSRSHVQDTLMRHLST